MNCEQDLNECESEPCGGNGECENMQNAYRCTCNHGYNGRQCNTGMFFVIILDFHVHSFHKIYGVRAFQHGSLEPAENFLQDYFPLCHAKCIFDWKSAVFP